MAHLPGRVKETTCRSTADLQQSAGSVPCARIAVSGAYGEIDFDYTLLVDGSGRMKGVYTITRPPSGKPAYDEVGITFFTPLDMDRIAWQREGLWSTYPENHIGRNRGIAVKVRVEPALTYRHKPTWPWYHDMEDFHLRGKDHQGYGTTRRRFLGMGVAGSAALAATRCIASEKMRDRTALAHRRRRIIFNDDGDDVWHADAKTPQGFVGVRLKHMLNTQVDTLFYCTTQSFNYFSHNTRIGETFLSKAGPFKHNNMQTLIGQGTDPLKIALRFAHKNNIEAFWTLRMNDIHDAFTRPLWPKWKSDHPEALLGKQADWSANPPGSQTRWWSGVNFNRPGSRSRRWGLTQFSAEKAFIYANAFCRRKWV